ncbi:MAG: hypothetical protein P4L22_03650 [Candidatus Babeliales bacterium]|nr:hypothetical protein [Candidatus Babeliales bacterium]
MLYNNRLILLLFITFWFIPSECAALLSKDSDANASSLVSINGPKIRKSKQEVIYQDKPDVVYKQQIYNNRRYYRPNYVKSHSRFSDPYWRKPFKSISFGFDI